MWINRTLSSVLLAQARFKPAILVTGARQTGKSSLLRRTLPEAHYVTLDAPSVADEAAFSPARFLDALPRPVIIDEIQMVPELFRELKVRIDEQRELNEAASRQLGSRPIQLFRKSADRRLLQVRGGGNSCRFENEIPL